MSSQKQLNVFVTGATGFLGRHTVAALRARNHRVIALARPGSRIPFTEDESLRVVRGDLLDAGSLLPAIEQADVVIHLAAIVVGNADAQFQTAVAGTLNLFRAIRSSQVRRVVLASSMSVYDWSAICGTLHDDSQLSVAPGLYHRDGYAVAKVWQERVARRAAMTQNLELVVLRPGFIYGASSATCSGIGKQFGPTYVVFGPSRELPLCYVENVAAAFAVAVDRADVGGKSMLVLDREPISAWRYAGLLTSRGKVTSRFRLPIPYLLARLLFMGAGVAKRLMVREKLSPSPGTPREGRGEGDLEHRKPLVEITLTPTLSSSSLSLRAEGRDTGRGGNETGSKLRGALLSRRFSARFKPLRFQRDRLDALLGADARPFTLKEALRRTFENDSVAGGSASVAAPSDRSDSHQSSVSAAQ